jgi:hypothetical protein
VHGEEVINKIFGNEESNKQGRLKSYNAKTMEEADEIANSLSAMSIVSTDDPPIFMSYNMTPDAKVPDDPKRVRGWIVHHVDLGILLKEKMDSLNAEAHLKYPGAESKYESLVDFFEDKLLEK